MLRRLRPAPRALLAAALLVSVAPPVAAAAKPAYTKKGKLRHAQGGGFQLAFRGEGSWGVDYSATFTGNNLSDTWTHKQASSFKWNLHSSDLINIPWPCKLGGSNLCALITGGSLEKGNQSLSYTVNDTHLSSVDPPQTQTCADSLGLDSKVDKVDPNAISVQGTKGGSLVIASLGANPEPFLGSSNAPGKWLFDATCHGLDATNLWQPGGDGSTSTQPASRFFTFKAPPIPVSAFATSQSITVAVSGPLAGNESAANCGVADTANVHCSATGSWRGTVTLTRHR